ncbi:MAG TPA: hypothetical protein VD902_08460 [Symbiobacteriaceae bacterium]|nr:hypothetical protein [Symbiobacteriaceae bacterium]
MSRPPAKNGNPYRFLWWLGGGLVLLLAGVLAAVMLAPGPKPPPDPERTLLWLFDPANPDAEAVAMVVEESQSQQRMVVVPFRVPNDVRGQYAERGADKARDMLGARLERQIHHHVFVPYSVLRSLVNGARGLQAGGRTMDGDHAVSYVLEGGVQAPNRGAEVMLALAGAVSANGLEMSPSEGLKLARQVETDMDLMMVPEALSRWSQFGNPQVKLSAGDDLSVLKQHLLPDGK